MSLKKDGSMATISFLYGEGLYMEGDALNAIQISADDIKVDAFDYKIEENKLVITSEQFVQAKELTITFAGTGYYNVTLYNKAGIPVKPFVLQWIKVENQCR